MKAFHIFSYNLLYCIFAELLTILLFRDKIYQLVTPFFLKNTVCELTNFSERGELLPAGDERTGATHTVALARHLHVADNRLQNEVNHRQN